MAAILPSFPWLFMQKPFQDELHSEAVTIQLKFLTTGLVKAVLASACDSLLLKKVRGLHLTQGAISFHFYYIYIYNDRWCHYSCQGLNSNTEPWESKNKQKNRGLRSIQCLFRGPCYEKKVGELLAYNMKISLKKYLFWRKQRKKEQQHSCLSYFDCEQRGWEDIKVETEATMIKWGNNPPTPHCLGHSRLALAPSPPLLPFSLCTRKTANMCRSDISFPQIMELPACNNNLNFTPWCLCAEGSPEQWHKLASMHWADRWLPRPPPIDPR